MTTTRRSLIARASLLLFAQAIASHAFAADAGTSAPADATGPTQPATAADQSPQQTRKNDPTLDVTVNAQRLNRARNGLSPEVGSSVYRITQADIDAMPQGANTPLNQVLLQAPGVANDSFGQVHVRGDHADLQYRLNGIVIPEPISGFGQSLDSRIIDQMSLITGALPAQYGYRTAGIVDIRTKSGDTGNGGTLDVFGGSHQTLRTSADVFGSSGAFSYYFAGSLGENNLGIEAPTSDGSPLHDHTRQGSGFGYMSYLLNPLTRVSLMFGTAANQFELPNTPGLTPAFTLDGRTSFDSAQLNETQSELNNFAVLALQGTNGGAFDYQVALFTRYTRTQFNPDPVGDLMFNGVASSDFHSNRANGVQVDTTYRLNNSHTLRAGLMMQQEHATFDDNVAVFPADADGNPLSNQPFTLADASSKTGYLYSAYVQDEWKVARSVTVNYGLRYDRMDEFVQASQLSPRIGVVWQPTNATTVHAGYSRYFTPPAFELVSDSTIGLFNGTTNQSPSSQNSLVKPERSHYFDIGITQRLTPALTVGLDAYYKKATDLLDEGQFGSALIFTPFNYARGRVYGVELTTSYHQDNVSAYLNVAYSRAQGTDIESAQFNFEPDELAYIANHWVSLDHDQRVTASFGGAYTLGRTTFTADGIVGSGLRSGFANTDSLPWYAQVNLGVIQHFDEPLVGNFDARLVLVNAFGRVYQLRDGSGIGVGAPQYGPQRAIYAGLTKHF
ncbi:TonB-dependent receptor [Paraburkholderia caballeronis]|uniref:Outer membrane receptor proteins, mostly Fe transport n=1 Tax=Paraburkholderia caballeronis TaxID=416943 RepID=A0A1H7S7P5_9BURK|nr:TonB-dependent receptor [Paraburkholderia caballeronis]PXW22884.1 outer membrane receptor protein involved in Fe transport [Paraburkholderia caballeronis]PXW97269.1 outer membrane receptor protein involved in Fe transport [Paraburkholderia caballeronis]RAJ93789.1 outer membrane receptor protein involved in Fe transport [Paraburkholderia caballeronis]SED58478.1 Outer membrane receptor proteins, mostly Fe transport [Paraburkholderia caballeronis]SEL67547.1 Outer membrane receptor proteins, mo